MSLNHKYYEVQVGEDVSGPFGFEQVVHLYRTAAVACDAGVRERGTDTWTRIGPFVDKHAAVAAPRAVPPSSVCESVMRVIAALCCVGAIVVLVLQSDKSGRLSADVGLGAIVACFLTGCVFWWMASVLAHLRGDMRKAKE